MLKFNKDVKLPDKPSELIRLAINDLVAVEQNPDYKVCMAIWYLRNPGDKCLVCFAGAVMAQTLGAESTSALNADSFPKDIGDKLVALDYFRVGWLGCGLTALGIQYRALDNIALQRYEDDPMGFKQDMVFLADSFERQGH